MRGSYNGNTSAFQAEAEGSIPLPRSNGWRAEQVTAPDCKSGASGIRGSSPWPSTIVKHIALRTQSIRGEDRSRSAARSPTQQCALRWCVSSVG